MTANLACLFLAIGIAILAGQCAADPSCMDNTVWRGQVDRYVLNMTHQPQVKRSLIPRAADLFEYGCSRLERVPNPCRDLSDDDDLLNWFVLFLQYNFWDMEEGRTPFVQFPFSWKFLQEGAEPTVYRIPDIGLEAVGAAAIMTAQRGLGKSYFPPDSGTGFWVRDVVFNEFIVGNSKFAGDKVINVFSKVHKNLVNIDFLGSAPNTSAFARYLMQTSFKQYHAYPKLRFVAMNETINTQRTLELFGACFACTNCPPGGDCPEAPLVARRDLFSALSSRSDPSAALPADLAIERARSAVRQAPLASTQDKGSDYLQSMANLRRK